VLNAGELAELIKPEISLHACGVNQGFCIIRLAVCNGAHANCVINPFRKRDGIVAIRA
jgi:hypothetical protein